MKDVGVTVGSTVRVLEDGKEIDQVVVLSLDQSGEKTKIEVKSLYLYPGTSHLFGLFGQGWKLLFEGPMAGCEKFFSPKAPFYVLEAI
jgi:hypothetical protein